MHTTDPAALSASPARPDGAPAWLNGNSHRLTSPLFAHTPMDTLVQTSSVLQSIVEQLRTDAEDPLPSICRFGIAHMLEVASHACLVVADHLDGVDMNGGAR